MRRKYPPQLRLIYILLASFMIFYFWPTDPSTVETESFSILPVSRQTQNDVFIFDLEKWRIFMLQNPKRVESGRLRFCNVPKDVIPIADAICASFGQSDCRRLPCSMVHSTSANIEDLRCMKGGRVLQSSDLGPNGSSDNTILCKYGVSLDLFSKKNNYLYYPSIVTDAVTHLTHTLYTDTLHRFYRSPESIWGLIFNFESIGNYPWAADSTILKLFNVTFGYDRNIYDFTPTPWLFNYVAHLKPDGQIMPIETVMNNKKPILSDRNRNLYWPNHQSVSLNSNGNDSSAVVNGLILWMNTNCHTKSKRTEYMNELMKFIEVDNYGTCGDKILKLPNHIVEIQNSANKNLRDRGSYKWETGKLELSKNYLFSIAIENTLDHDYITEKLWHSFVAGSVPIYLGAPNIDEWLPCEMDCIIDLRRFKNAEDAASFIKTVAMNRTLYESFHRWRKEPIRPKFQKMLNYFHKISQYHINCVVCDFSHRIRNGEKFEDMKNELKTKIGFF